MSFPDSWTQDTPSALIEMAHSAQAPGTWALAFYLAQGARDVNVCNKNGRPLLHGTLRAMILRGDSVPLTRPEALPEYPLTREARWPALVPEIDARERLAALLIAEGADPWVKDPDGFDAMDWAIRCGSPGLFLQLSSHPGCPEKASLWGRTVSVEQQTLPSLYTQRKNLDLKQGKQHALPWLHACVHRENWVLFDVLRKTGAPLDGRDVRGWLPAAWARTSNAIERMAERGALPASEKDRMATQMAWTRRQTLKLVDGNLKIEAMIQQWESYTPQSQISQQATEWVRLMELWFARKVMGNIPCPMNFPAPSQEARAFRKKNSRGSARGTWSLLGVFLDAVLKDAPNLWLNRPNHSPSPWLKAINQWWTEGSDAEVTSWLDESIRPGLTARGMITLLILLNDNKETETTRLKTFIQAQPEKSFRAAVDAQCEFLKGASSKRKGVILYQWMKVLKHLSTMPQNTVAAFASSGAQSEWKRVIDGLSDCEYPYQWSVETMAALTQKVHRQIKTGCTPEMFGLAKSLVKMNSQCVSLRYGFSESDKRQAGDFMVTKGKLFIDLAAIHRDQGDIGTWFDTPPFEARDIEQMKFRSKATAEHVNVIQMTHSLEMAVPAVEAKATIKVRM